MNIAVVTTSNEYFIRPDITWERKNSDLFIADSIRKISFTPVLFTKLSKPGKSIGLRFTGRYYESINYGVLIYAEDLVEKGNVGFAQANCIDNTSFLPMPLYNKLTLNNFDNEFILKMDGKEIFKYYNKDEKLINRAISTASGMSYLKIGDMVAIELDERKLLFDRDKLAADTEFVHISGTYCENETIDFKIIL